MDGKTAGTAIARLQSGGMSAREAADWVDKHGPIYLPTNGATYPISSINGSGHHLA